MKVYDACFSPDGSRLSVVDSRGRISVFGLDKPDKFRGVREQQYFSTDYSGTNWDAYGWAMDINTQMPMNEAPVGRLGMALGTAYDPEPTLKGRGPSPLSHAEMRRMLEVQRRDARGVGALMDRTYKLFKRNREHGRQSRPYVGARPLHPKSPSERRGSGAASRAAVLGSVDPQRYRPSPQAQAQPVDSDSGDDSGDSDWANNNNNDDDDSDGGRYHRARDYRITHRTRSGRAVERNRWIECPDMTRSEREARAKARAARARGDTGGRRSVFDDDGDDDVEVPISYDERSDVDDGDSDDYADGGEARARRRVAISSSRTSSRSSSRGVHGAEAAGRKKQAGRLIKKSQRATVGDDDDDDEFEFEEVVTGDVSKKARPGGRPRGGGSWSVHNGRRVVPMDAPVDRAWLQPDAQVEAQYCPQVGDRVVYFQQGHCDVLSSFAEHGSPPWLSFASTDWPVVECVVRDIAYDFPTEKEFQRCRSVIARVTLAIARTPVRWHLSSAGHMQVGTYRAPHLTPYLTLF